MDFGCSKTTWNDGLRSTRLQLQDAIGLACELIRFEISGRRFTRAVKLGIQAA
jgi:hypothetical protein